MIKARVEIRLKKGVVDPEGKNIVKALNLLGFKNVKDVKQVLEMLYQEAQDALRELYKEEDIKRGYFISKDREGNIKEFPIATISMAAASTLNYKSSQEISKRLAELKKESKKLLKPVVEESSEALLVQTT